MSIVKPRRVKLYTPEMTYHQCWDKANTSMRFILYKPTCNSHVIIVHTLYVLFIARGMNVEIHIRIV